MRAFVFDGYDEVDISRSHISTVIGCYLLSGRPALQTLTRFLHGRDHLELDIGRELDAARPACAAHLHSLHTAARGVPNAEQARFIAYARSTLDKTHMKPKQVYSAIINTKDPYAWVNQEAFGRGGHSAIAQSSARLSPTSAACAGLCSNTPAAAPSLLLCLLPAPHATAPLACA